MFAIVDCETTGFGKHDRIVELAAVVVDDKTFSIVDEYDTLVNPERDTGPVGIHGVTSSMVEAAPTFKEIVGTLARHLDGKVLAAHNLKFDVRMLRQEFDRLNVNFEPGQGHCTLELTSEKLNIACARYGITLDGHHRALADARAAAELMRHFREDIGNGIPAGVAIGGLPINSRTLRRDAGTGSQQSHMARIVARAQYPTSNGALLAYLDTLNWVLDDLVITQAEREYMGIVATELGIDSTQIKSAHSAYVQSIINATQRDGVISQAEHTMIRNVATVLGLDSVEIPDVTEKVELDALRAGLRICFTGTVVIKGVEVGRSRLEACATHVGFQPVSNVTKKGCDLLVAADPSSMSGKAKKARHFSIPIISIEKFGEMIGVSPEDWME